LAAAITMYRRLSNIK